MKKHLFGLALFSLIVGSAIFFKAIFFASVYKYDVIRTFPENSCWKMKRETVQAQQTEVKTTKPLIRQAIFNLNTKQMDWDLIVPETTSIVLHFFVKDSLGARHLNSEFIPIYSVNKTGTNNGILEITSSFLWLDNLDSYQNLYIVPEVMSRREFSKKGIRPVFDEISAVPVSLYYGQTGYPKVKYQRK